MLRWLGTVSALAAVVILSMATGYPAIRGSLRVSAGFLKRVVRGRGQVHLAWAMAEPEREGLSRPVLDSLGPMLGSQGTEAFVVVRGGHLVYEWYSPKSGPNARHGLAAMAKAVTGSVAVLAAASDRRLALDDLASKYIPAWQTDTVRSRIRIWQLTSHHSGMDDVDFELGAAHKLEGWKQRYYDNPESRFEFAVGTAPILFPPGSRFNYSGVGYYALAYALGVSLKGSVEPDAQALLRDRIMLPLGIPDEDWRLSYGHSYSVDGMTLYALGSGASYTARAVARIGQLILDHGRLGERWLLDSAIVAQAFEPAPESIPPAVADPPAAPIARGGGWELNLRGTWPEVPRDAFAGMGNGHEVILVVPSLDLIVVRTGTAFSANAEEYESVLCERVFNPVMRAVIGPSSRMRGLPPRLHVNRVVRPLAVSAGGV